MSPSPHTVPHELGWPEQVKPGSVLQSASQPSPATLPPSSHCSAPVTRPFPQSNVQTLGEPVHVKPFSKKNPTAYLGADELDWPAIMTAAESVGGIQWYIIEYEHEGKPPLQALKANLEAFKKMRS